MALFLPAETAEADVLIEHVGHSRVSNVRGILQSSPELCIESGNGMDIRQKKWIGSAFQYAIWAGDARICQLMFDALPRSEKGELTRQIMLEQVKAVQKRFDLSLLLGKLERCININPDKLQKRWCKKAGGLQSDLPAHIRHEYCYPGRAFNDMTNFDIRQKHKPSLNVVVMKESETVTWESSGTGLGTRFAFTRGLPTDHGCIGTAYPVDTWIKNDLSALKNLKAQREQDMEAFIQLLEKPLFDAESEQSASPNSSGPSS